MPSPPVITQFANPDPDAAPLNITQLVLLLNTLVSSVIQGSYIPYVIQNGTPRPEDRDKAWIYVDSQGRPLETRIWWDNGGAWRRIYNGMIGEVRYYTGDPSHDFDSNGLGFPPGAHAGTYDGWHLCNGKDGTPDYSDKFIFSAHMTDTNDYDSGWKAKVENESGTLEDQSTGGSERTLIEAKHLPPLDLAITGKEQGSAGPTANEVIVDRNYGATSHTKDFGIIYGTPDTQIKYPNMPPFVVAAPIIFVGYSA